MDEMTFNPTRVEIINIIIIFIGIINIPTLSFKYIDIEGVYPTGPYCIIIIVGNFSIPDIWVMLPSKRMINVLDIKA
jgi:hypothetical protein